MEIEQAKFVQDLESSGVLVEAGLCCIGRELQNGSAPDLEAFRIGETPEASEARIDFAWKLRNLDGWSFGRIAALLRRTPEEVGRMIATRNPFGSIK